MRIPGTYEDLIGQARQARVNGQVGPAVMLYSRVVDRLSSVIPNLTAPDEKLREYLVVAADELQLVLDWADDRTSALTLCLRMADVDREDSHVWRRRAATERIHSGDVEEGLADLRHLMAEEPDDFWHAIELTARLLDLDRLDEAEAALIGAERKARGGEELGLVSWTRSRLLRVRGQIARSAEEWEVACRHDPFFKRASEAIYRMFIAAGDYESALPYLSQEGNTLVEGYYRGLLAHLQGDTKRAQKAWRRVAQSQPMESEAGWESWAMAQIRLGEAQTALALVSDLVRQGYTTEQCYLVAGLASALLGDAEAAQTNTGIALRIRRQTFGPRALLPADLWLDFQELVADEGLKQELRSRFAAQ